MRIQILAAAIAFLSACATTPPGATPIAASQATTSSAAPSRALQLLRAAGGAEAPTQEEVERTLGAPDIARRDGAGAALTYRLESCALLLLFSADHQQAMRLAAAHPSARQGQQAPSLEQCAAEASARRS